MLELISTGDGSKTIYNSLVGENYHSRHGALQESRHVFLDSGLKYFLAQNAAPEISVLEVGFGTGLNFLLSADYCRQNHKGLDYAGIEAYPLAEAFISETGYNQYIWPGIWDSFVDAYPQALAGPVQISSCHLQIVCCQLLAFKGNQKYDVIYFDAFASLRQPEMWTAQAIGHTVQYLKPGGVFVTYAITGNLKRILRALGFIIEKVPGAAGKREMLRAVKCQAL